MNNDYWFVQPLVTAATGLLVFFGVLLTLRRNREALLTQQLEKRAYEQLRKLQQAYAEFASAALTLLETRSIMATWAFTFDNVVKRKPQPPKEELDYHQERIARLQDGDLSKQSAELKSAVAALWLTDDKKHRLELMEELYRRAAAESYPPMQWEEVFNKIRDDIEEFVQGTAGQLEKEYAYAFQKAQKGEYPLREQVFRVSTVVTLASLVASLWTAFRDYQRFQAEKKQRASSRR